MADFVKRLTDIPEELRFVDRADRKKALPSKLEELRKDLKGTLYLPISGGADTLKKVPHAKVDLQELVFLLMKASFVGYRSGSTLQHRVLY